MGRPIKGASVRRKTFTFRVTDELRAKLVDVAVAEGRSVSDVIELRLEQSFDREVLLARVRDAVSLQQLQLGQMAQFSQGWQQYQSALAARPMTQLQVQAARDALVTWRESWD